MNISFEYLYRDSGNFKNWSFIVFSNREKIPIEIAIKQIIANLDEGLYFKAEDLSVTDLHFEEFNPTLDHHWLEFSCCSATTDQITDIYQRDIQEIIKKLSLSKKQGKYFYVNRS
jgi:hypothetical protein